MVSLAVLQVLHAYPVAGSHKAWGTFLFVPVGALAMVRGWNTLFARQSAGNAIRRWLPAMVVAVALSSPTLWIANAQWTGCRRCCQQSQCRLACQAQRTSGCSGLRRRHSNGLPRDLTRRCRTFITMPGLNSLYLFTGAEPPTAMNVGDWMNLFTVEQQQELRDRFSRSPPPLCVVRERKVVSWWGRKRPGAGESDQPLARYIEDEFLTVDECLSMSSWSSVPRRPASQDRPMRRWSPPDGRIARTSWSR